MTNKINMVINLSILALLIYLSVAIKKIEDKVFPDPNVMIPLAEKNVTNDEFENMIKICWIFSINLKVPS